ncbi:glycosyltransferase family 4 protein [Brevibacillus sp. 179-C9.3 HS]|uniref:glycosyltransferase family 4 protein n=1 Tax=unclassified Brevibacillus TaxID=2684853 RepID=UPI0039A0C01F
MNICIDAQPLQTAGSRTRGIGHYTRSQLNQVLVLDKKNQYKLWLYDKNIDSGIIENASLENYYFNFGIDNFLLDSNVRDSLVASLIKKTITHQRADLIHFTSPFDQWNIFDTGWYSNIPTVATIYDLIPLIFKEVYLADPNSQKAYFQRVDFIKNLTRMMAISESVKEDLVNYLHIDPEKIDVIYGGIDNSFKKISISNDEEYRLKNKFGINNEFVMCTGGADYRKNLEGLIKSFSMMSKEVLVQHQLVIVCKIDANYKKALKDLAEKMGIGDKLVLTDYVTKDELIRLYNLAKAFAFVSLYEGFGLPIVEAMACGLPVITSNNSSLREIAGDAALLVDPKNNKMIAQNIERVLTDQFLRAKLIQKGFYQREKFTWDKVAEKTIESYEKCMSSKTRVTHKTTSEKKRVAFFSPILPIKSGISDYSEDLLPYLKKYGLEIELFIDSYKPTSMSISHEFKIYDYKKFEEMNSQKDYDVIIYQMGNSTTPT